MITWKNILQPIPASVPKNCTLSDAARLLRKSAAGILFVKDWDDILGYIDSHSLLDQLGCSPSPVQSIDYKTDVMIVAENAPVEFYHNVSLVLAKNKQGEFVGYSTLMAARQDVNALQLAQMRGIFDNAGIGIVTTNTQFQITFLNEKAEDIFGLTRNVLLYRNYKTLLLTQENLDEVLEGKQLVSVASSFNSKPILGNFSPLYENEHIIGIVHLFYPRNQLEEAVQELELVRNLNEDLQALYSSSNEQLVVLDKAGTIIRLSGAFSPDIWHTSNPEDIIGSSVYRLEQEGIFPADIVERCRKQKQKIMHVQETQRGRRLWAIAVPVLQGKQIAKIVIILRDITDLNEYQAETHANDIKEIPAHKPLIYRSKTMEDIVEQAKRIAKVDSTVLLCGESGVGKEVFAQTIHVHSPRKDKPFVRVNCGAIPENLMESEFFGYEAGSFTGADRKGKLGLFELAHTGTIFLDEVGELPLNLQVKLLRVLQEREIQRIGGTQMIPVDVRVIAATNRDLREMIREKTFREDLYYRLHVIPLYIPTLRQRKVDIIPLSLYFLEYYNKRYDKEKQLSREAVEILENYEWPGNIRELQNVIERLVVITRDSFIEGKDVLSALYGEAKKEESTKRIIHDILPLKDVLEQVEYELLSLALQKYHTAAETAQALGISESTISRKIKRRFG